MGDGACLGEGGMDWGTAGLRIGVVRVRGTEDTDAGVLVFVRKEDVSESACERWPD